VVPSAGLPGLVLVLARIAHYVAHYE